MSADLSPPDLSNPDPATPPSDATFSTAKARLIEARMQDESVGMSSSSPPSPKAENVPPDLEGGGDTTAIKMAYNMGRLSGGAGLVGAGVGDEAKSVLSEMDIALGGLSEWR